MPISAMGRLFRGGRGRTAIACCCHVRNGTAISGLCCFMDGIHLWLMSLPERLPSDLFRKRRRKFPYVGTNSIFQKEINQVQEKPAMPSRLKPELFYNMCEHKEEGVWKNWKYLRSCLPRQNKK